MSLALPDRHLANENYLKSGRFLAYRTSMTSMKRSSHTTESETDKRVFVIISDALRFEIANELGAIINNEKRFKAEVSTQLGVLPSYTQLGMAALLPHSAQLPARAKARLFMWMVFLHRV